MAKYGSFNTRSTSQREKVPGFDMEKNNAGGYGFLADDWKRLRRFLIIGSDSGSYYVSDRDLTHQNADVVLRCIKEDGHRTVRAIIDVSTVGLAPDNDPAVFALAMCASFGDHDTRKYAFECLNVICRIPTHLFHFARFCEQMRGWGRGLRSAIGKWYLSKDLDDLAFHLVKYQQRDGWSNADLLRLSHPKGATEAQSAVFRWAMGRNVHDDEVWEKLSSDLDVSPIVYFEELKGETDLKKVIKILRDSRLPHEAVPTEWKNTPDVWEVLLETMPMTAMVRNLAKVSSLGMTVSNLSPTTLKITAKLTDPQALKRSRIHPMQILSALKVYASGHGVLGDLRWIPNQSIIYALDTAFYRSFMNVEPINKRLLVAVDESGSMRQQMKGKTPISCYEAAMAQAMVFAHASPTVDFIGFDDALYPMELHSGMRMTEVLGRASHTSGTDCSLPFIHASKMAKKGIVYDAVIMFSDLETWAGSVHPFQALKSYRNSVNPDTKFVVSDQVANHTSLIEPDDLNSLEIAGFDTSAPQIVREFLLGEF